MHLISYADQNILFVHTRRVTYNLIASFGLYFFPIHFLYSHIAFVLRFRSSIRKKNKVHFLQSNFESPNSTSPTWSKIKGRAARAASGFCRFRPFREANCRWLRLNFTWAFQRSTGIWLGWSHAWRDYCGFFCYGQNYISVRIIRMFWTSQMNLIFIAFSIFPRYQFHWQRKSRVTE